MRKNIVKNTAKNTIDVVNIHTFLICQYLFRALSTVISFIIVKSTYSQFLAKVAEIQYFKIMNGKINDITPQNYILLVA